MWSYAGWSLFAACIVGSLSRFCSILVTSLCILISILRLFSSSLPGEFEDWKAAVEFVSKHNADLNLVYSGLIESKYPQYYIDDESISYLSSPWKVYDNKNNFYPLSKNDYGNATLLDNLINKNTVGAVVREYKDSEVLNCAQVIDFMQRNGFRVVEKSAFNGTCGVVFQSIN